MARIVREPRTMRVVALLLLIAACEGPGGPAGSAGTDGENGQPGAMGDPGSTGTSNPTPWVVGDGVDVTVTGLTVATTGAIVSFRLRDAAGAPLDRTGHLTAGKVNVAFVLAQLAENADGSPAQYTAYTTNSASQAATEAVEANFAVVDVTAGTYTYTLAAALTNLDPTKTQTVLAVADRTTGTTRTFDRDTFSVRPTGPAPITRQLVTDASCGGCHATSLATHGGRYTSAAQCVMCHQPQSTDPESGNTVDFKVMIHKIHRGVDLPSVKAGTPYQIIGFGNSVNDFSTIEFPQNIARCTTCHAGAQPDRWKTTITKAACGSCHDMTVFSFAEVTATRPLHGGGEQLTEGNCAVCHGPTAAIAPIEAKHYTGLLDPAATKVALELQSITSTGPGQIPTMTFRVTVNAAPRDIITAPLTRLTATVAGPTTDISSFWQARIQGAPTVGTLVAVDAPNGVFAYTFPATLPIPPTATGSYQVGLEGYIQNAVVPPATSAPRYAALNPVLPFAVTDATPQPRRTIVDLAKCNSCHQSLALHGGARTNPQYCVSCHNTTGVNDRTARFEGGSALEEPLDFRVMIHKIHRGDELTQFYAIGGTAGSVANPAGAPTSFNDVRYPRPRNECEACHASKNWTLPLTASPAYAPSTMIEMSCSEPAAADTNTFCDNPFWTATTTTRISPEASVCTSCHDAPDTAAHAMLNTTSSGLEACATCHGAGKLVDVSLFHRP